MAKRNVVLTGLLSFGAGVAVGANWKELGKKAAPLLEKLGLQMTDVADFLANMANEELNRPAKKTKSRRSASQNRRKKGTPHKPLTGLAVSNGHHSSPKSERKQSRTRKTILGNV